MKRVIIACCLVMLSNTAFAGEIVNDAKKQITEEKYRSLVTKAKILMERKATLEARIEEIAKKLSSLDSGEDVEIGDDRCTTFTCSTLTAPVFTIK